MIHDLRVIRDSVLRFISNQFVKRFLNPPRSIWEYSTSQCSSSQKHLGICACGDPGFDSVSSIINYENRHFHEEDKKNTEFRATQFEVRKNCMVKIQTNRSLVRYKLLCFFFYFCCCYYCCWLFDLFLHNAWLRHFFLFLRFFGFLHLGSILLDAVGYLFIIRTIIVQ